MKCMKRKIATLAVGLLLGASSAQALTFPNFNYFQYGDFRSYSLPLLNQFYGFPTNKGNYILDSSPGKIANDIIVYTGTNGQGMNTNNLIMGDDAYQAPAGNTSFFSTSLPTPVDPGGAGQFVGDTANTWDVQLGALANYLNGSDLFLFYNHNQTGGAQYLWAWGRVTLIDTTGVKTALNFDFTNSPMGGTPNGSELAYTSTGAAVPQPNTFVPPVPVIADPNYVYVPGQVNGVNHNLGQDDAAFALFSPELNAYIHMPNFGGYDVLQIDMRLAGLNNGPEQLFIQKGHNVPVVPEPGTIMLLGGGLIGLGLYGRRKIRK